jgi:hypothetical protein
MKEGLPVWKQKHRLRLADVVAVDVADKAAVLTAAAARAVVLVADKVVVSVVVPQVVLAVAELAVRVAHVNQIRTERALITQGAHL